MRNLALLWACLVCAAGARRVHTPTKSAQGRADRKTPMEGESDALIESGARVGAQSPFALLHSLAAFLLALRPTTAFKPSGSWGVGCARYPSLRANARPTPLCSRSLARRGTAPRVAAAESPLTVDVAVIGGGPAGYAMAAQLHGTHGHKVALVDPRPEGMWPNNYGSWRVEWEALAQKLGMPELLTDCINQEWPITDCFFGGSWDMDWEQRTRLDRAYLQVSRVKLKAALSAKFGDGVTVLPTLLRAKTIAPNLFDGNLVHDSEGSTLTLQDGTSLRAKLVVDATGFESKLVARESDMLAGLSQPLPPGYQIAYGFSCDVEGKGIGPYDTGAMTLFDYRTDHLEAAVASADTPDAKAKAEAALRDSETRPTFMYVMPEGTTADGNTRAFFEETSLVGRGERRLEFSTLKERALLRLKHLGLSVREGSVSEEEYCYIPMGGNLPDLTQRVIAIGGAAATVHPATGYQLCRMLASSGDVAAAISTALRSGATPDVAAAAAYRALWSPQLRYQRDFQVFGGEFLGDQKVEKLRGFFDAFFKLDMKVWGGFLAGWPGLPGNEYHDQWNKRLKFGLELFFNFPPPVALALMTYAVTFSLQYGGNLLRSFLTPLFGANGGITPLEREKLDEQVFSTYMAGDVAAKREALSMLQAPGGNGEPSPQVAELATSES
mmetsp:Transcript_93243/g.179158  ORF Transcript_93243/g.179158 Transcript_93243/m.179158 type:complete len:668 (-) Transcript_93243:9-2012(-)